MTEIHHNSIDPKISEQILRTNRELAILYEISNSMRSTLELNSILYIILTGVTVHSGLSFNRAILFLINSKERCLEPKMAIGPESGEEAKKIWHYIDESRQNIEDLIKDERQESTGESALFQSVKDMKIPLAGPENSLLSQAFHQAKPIHITKEHIADYAADPLLRAFKTNEVIIMPLRAKDKVNGLIVADNLYTQKPITEEDLKIFTLMANQAGLAIENSRLYEMVRQKSHMDSLTNLWNHGFFQDQLGLEVEAGKKKNTPLTLLILDLDDFKKLNDTCGHQNGDIILKELAEILKNSSREIDYVCRYGGEEFALILTQTGKETGIAIAQRIRERIEQHDFSALVPVSSSAPSMISKLFKPPSQGQDQPKKITVSIGVSAFPDDAQTREELINKADKAMYIAKFGGKNQVSVA